MDTGITRDVLFVTSIVAKAEILSLLSILEDVCQQVGFYDPENLSVGDRFFKQTLLEVEKIFRHLEDGDPAFAARLHGSFEAALEQAREDRKPRTQGHADAVPWTMSGEDGAVRPTG